MSAAEIARKSFMISAKSGVKTQTPAAEAPPTYTPPPPVFLHFSRCDFTAAVHTLSSLGLPLPGGKQTEREGGGFRHIMSE